MLISLLCFAGCATTNQPILCTAGTDCQAKWSRAMQWLQQNSSWKIETSTEDRLLTEGPLDSAKPAFEVTKAARDDGRIEITMRAWCGTGQCDPLIPELEKSFRRYVNGG